MMSHSPYFYIFFLIFLKTSATFAAETPPAYTATDLILLNCGEPTNLNDTSNRSWAGGDERSRYAPSNAATISAALAASHMDPSVSKVPYQTARVFYSPFTYSFPLSPGPKFLRLYFYPDVYSGFNTSQSLFSLTANSFTLLHNFSAFLYSKNASRPSFIKEFVVSVGGNQRNERIQLIFSPNPDSFAFVNGIEIISMPDTLYFQGAPIKFGTGIFDLRNDTALENLCRLNVGGARVDIQDDTGMFRAWSPDDDYIFGGDFGYTPHLENVQVKYSVGTPPYTAPATVYTSARVMANTSVSLDWIFEVDSGFHYLLRLHYCEFTLGVRAQNQRVFTININNQTTDYDYDVIALAGGPDIPIFKDYIIWVPDDGRRGKQGLRLSLYPYRESKSQYYSALLNGLEMFKLSDAEDSLAAANPELKVDYSPLPVTPQQKNKSGGSSVIYATTGSVIGVLAVVGVLSFFILQRKHKIKKLYHSYYSSAAKSSWLPLSNTSSSTTTTGTGSGVSLHSEFCRCFSFDDIKTATCNFDRNFIIGKGGFRCVYRGIIDNGSTTVAIKRLNPSSNQGAHEFLTEIHMLSKLRHLHLVSLIGCCDEQGEMILVYDYMDHGSLRDHLYNSENTPLSWKQRLQICMGAAKGLNYLHTGAEHATIHRDVKSTNILLDENWVAKISDFGLSKMGQTNDSFTHISTNVKGTFGYLDPKYLSTHQLTRKSDVYAFGVVLFEVVSGRPAVDVSLEEEQHSLADWARYCVREGEVDQLLDPNLMGQISSACLEIYIRIACRCIHIQPLERPTMADVVMGLELALTLQHTTNPVEESDYAGIICCDQSEVVMSMDHTTGSIGESDTSTRKSRGD